MLNLCIICHVCPQCKILLFHSLVILCTFVNKTCLHMENRACTLGNLRALIRLSTGGIHQAEISDLQAVCAKRDFDGNFDGVLRLKF